MSPADLSVRETSKNVQHQMPLDPSEDLQSPAEFQEMWNENVNKVYFMVASQ